jgi:hypothetical protein
VPLGAETTSSHSHFEDNSSPNISGSDYLIQACLFDMNKLLKNLILLRQHVLLLYKHSITYIPLLLTSKFYASPKTLWFALPDRQWLRIVNTDTWGQCYKTFLSVIYENS